MPRTAAQRGGVGRAVSVDDFARIVERPDDDRSDTPVALPWDPRPRVLKALRLQLGRHGRQLREEARVHLDEERRAKVPGVPRDQGVSLGVGEV